MSITPIGYAILDTAKHVQVYVIFKNTYEHDVILKGFDKNGIEICRSAYYLSGKRSESTYHDFVFNIAAPVNLATYFSIEKVK